MEDNENYEDKVIKAEATFEYYREEFLILHKENKELRNLIDKTIEDIEFCRKSINEERNLSRDRRTRKEMTSCENILRERVKYLKEGREV